jgi:SAM-dependent methyltransferase
MFLTTLEIGAGLGEHLTYESLTSEQRKNYYAVDIRENMIDEFRRRHPGVHGLVADCQERLDFPDGYFDRVLAIHVLEHLPNLPAAVRELHRVCNPRTGMLSVVLPCEGGFAYGLARRISAQRIFERRYGQPYKSFIEREHINCPQEIFDELKPYFEPTTKTFFPLRIPSVTINLCIGMTMRPLINTLGLPMVL